MLVSYSSRDPWSLPFIILAGMLPCTLLDEVGVRLRLLQQPEQGEDKPFTCPPDRVPLLWLRSPLPSQIVHRRAYDCCSTPSRARTSHRPDSRPKDPNPGRTDQG